MKDINEDVFFNQYGSDRPIMDRLVRPTGRLMVLIHIHEQALLFVYMNKMKTSVDWTVRRWKLLDWLDLTMWKTSTFDRLGVAPVTEKVRHIFDETIMSCVQPAYYLLWRKRSPVLPGRTDIISAVTVLAVDRYHHGEDMRSVHSCPENTSDRVKQ